MGNRYIKGLFFCFLLLALAYDALGQSGFPYCEPFTNTTTRANTVFGGTNTRLTSSNPDPVGDGVLRLTSNATNQTGYVYVDIPFSSTYGIKTSFEYFTYGGTGADGFTFFLFDAAVPTFKTGGFGGSLGYAPNTNTNSTIVGGLSGGYIGIGFDEYGNYGNTIEGKSGGFAGNNLYDTRYANSVVIRGPHSESYKFIQGRRTNTDTNGSIPGLSTSRQFTIASGGEGTNRVTNRNQVGYRKVFIDMVPATNGVGFTINLEMEVTTIANIPRPVKIFEAVSYPFNPPQNLKIGFAASTGGSTNFHEIRNLTVQVSDDEGLENPIASDKDFKACEGRANIIEIKVLEDVVLKNDPNNNFIRCLQLGKNIEDLTPVDTDICTIVQCDPAKQEINTDKGVFRANTEGGTITFVPNSTFTDGEEVIYYTVTDNFGKTSAPKAITVTINPVPTAEITASYPTPFFIGDNVTLTANTGDGYSYQWLRDGEEISVATGAVYQTSIRGDYTVRVTKNQLCPVVSNTIQVNPSPAPAISVVNGNLVAETCQNDGSANFTVSNTYPNAYYKVMDSEGRDVRDWTIFTESSLTVANLAFGNYRLLIRDRYRSIQEAFIHPFTIADGRIIEIATAVENIKCVGDQFGRIRFSVGRLTNANNIRVNYRIEGGNFYGEKTIGVGGGFSDYIKNEITGNTNFPAGTYFFEVRQGGGNSNCILKFTIIIKEPDLALGATVTTEVSACQGNTATVNPVGGWGGYTYLWSDGQTTQMATGLAAGTYTVRVRDAEGCEFTVDPVNIAQNNGVILRAESIDPSCKAQDGVIKITETNITLQQRYLIQWRQDDPNTGPEVGNMETASGLGQGKYFLIVTEINNPTCKIIREFDLINNGSVVEVLDNDEPEICEGETVRLRPLVEDAAGTVNFLWYRDAEKTVPVIDNSEIPDMDNQTIYHINAAGELIIERLPYSTDLYHYYVEAVGDDVCQSQPGKLKEVKVQVNPIPPPPKININGGILRL